MFEEQVGWAVDAGVDFIVGETFCWGGEALIALEAIRRAGKPAVITLAMHQEGTTREGWTIAERRAGGSRTPAPTSSASTARAGPRRCCRCSGGSAPPCNVPRGGAAGALPHDAGGADLPVAARPGLLLHPRRPAVPDRARSVHVQPLRDRRVRPERPAPSASATSASAAAPARTTSASLAEALGRRPPASRYSPDMSKHMRWVRTSA